ncbi:MAG: PAS domain-containing protein, partial [Candidatus Sedimenticola sp. (ex Thyasira tokunagai)]
MPTLLPLWRKARRGSSAASRLPGFTSLHFVLHGWQRQKNSQLNRSEQRMRDITSKLAEGLVVLDRDARVSYMNPEAERLLGWPADKLIGKSLHECIHRDIDGNPIHEGDCAVTKAF